MRSREASFTQPTHISAVSQLLLELQHSGLFPSLEQIHWHVSAFELVSVALTTGPLRALQLILEECSVFQGCRLVPTCVGDADNFGMRRIQNVDVVDGDEDVTDLEAGFFRRSSRFDGRNDNRTRSVDPESKFARLALYHDHVIAFC